MTNSIKQKILDYLTEHPGFQFGGSIEDFIRSTDGHKASNASRRCRELEDEGKIESFYTTIPGVANKVVQYRIRQIVPEKVRIWQAQFEKTEVKETAKLPTLF